VVGARPAPGRGRGWSPEGDGGGAGSSRRCPLSQGWVPGSELSARTGDRCLWVEPGGAEGDFDPPGLAAGLRSPRSGHTYRSCPPRCNPPRFCPHALAAPRLPLRALAGDARWGWAWRRRWSLGFAVGKGTKTRRRGKRRGPKRRRWGETSPAAASAPAVLGGRGSPGIAGASCLLPCSLSQELGRGTGLCLRRLLALGSGDVACLSLPGPAPPAWRGSCGWTPRQCPSAGSLAEGRWESGGRAGA